MLRTPAGRRAVAVAAALGAPLALSSAAHAAWFNAADLTGAASGARIVTSGTAGAVAAAATGFSGALAGAAHAPGGAFGPPAVLAPGTEDFPAQIGPGGAILTGTADRPAISRLRPDGSVSPAFPFGESGSTAIGTAAVAPSRAALAVVSDEDGNVQLWRQSSEAAAPVRLAQNSLLAPGPGSLRLTGRDARGRRLPRARYRVSLTATDAAGNRSAPVFIRFTLC